MNTRLEKETLKEIYLKCEEIKKNKKELKELRIKLELIRSNLYGKKLTRKK